MKLFIIICAVLLEIAASAQVVVREATAAEAAAGVAGSPVYMSPRRAAGSGGGNTGLGLGSGRTFYVATNGNDATAAVNSLVSPFTIFGALRRASNYGDTVYVLNGNYYPSNCLSISNGVNLVGQSRWATVLNQTNVTGGSFFKPKDNVRLSTFKFTGGGVATAFMGNETPGAIWTNVVVDNIYAVPDADFYYGSQGINSTNVLTIQNSIIAGDWDYVVPNGNYGSITLRDNIFVASTNHFSRITGSSFLPVSDYNGSWYNFGNNGAGWANGINFNGTKFYGSPAAHFSGPFPLMQSQSLPPNTGSFLDVDRGASWNMSGVIMTYVPSTNGCYYNQMVLLNFGAPDTAANSTFTLKFAIGDVVHKQDKYSTVGYWTNSSGYTVALNDPFDMNVGGTVPPTWSINVNAGDPLVRQLYQVNAAMVITNITLTNSSWSAFNGSGAVGISYFTNTLVPLTKASIVLPQSYGGALQADWTGTNLFYYLRKTVTPPDPITNTIVYWNSNQVLYGITTTKTNLISDLR